MTELATEAGPGQRGPGRLTVLSGPSGVGKGTVIAAVRRRHPEVWVSVSCTTRTPRPGETEGVQYHFAGLDEFHKMVEHGEFLEWARYAGNLYGTPRQPLLDRLASGVPAVLEIELQGARQVRQAMPEAQFVFLAPPSWTELERRLIGRGTEPVDLRWARLDQAKVELSAESEFDVTIVNDDVGRAADGLVELIRFPTPHREG
ncbi:MAG TPA: guanylate kinase [Mycobacteriales bacterium]|nr:guanylate kinase [Mycobacteriales bacterium]